MWALKLVDVIPRRVPRPLRSPSTTGPPLNQAPSDEAPVRPRSEAQPGLPPPQVEQAACAGAQNMPITRASVSGETRT